MTDLDAFKYEQEVLRPLRRRQGPIGDADLARRYAVEPGMNAVALAARLDEVRAYWRRRAAVNDSVAEVCADLLQTDEELQAEAGPAMLDPAWWSRRSGTGGPAADPGPGGSATAEPASGVGTGPAGTGQPGTGGAGTGQAGTASTEPAATDGGPRPAPVAFYRKWPAQTRRLLRDELLATGGAVRPAPPPTAAPTGLTAEYDSGAMVVRWDGSVGARYRLVCASGPLTDPAGGRLVGESAAGSVRDTGPAFGTPQCYTLFRGEVAVGSVTIEVLPPVVDVAVGYGTDRVRVTWIVDPAAVAVRVCRRTDRPPVSPDDGVVVDVSAAGYDDQAGMSALPVHYGLTAVYRDATGAERLAPTVVVTATPDDIVEALRDVTVTPAGGHGDRARVRMSWPGALGDAVRVYRCDRVPPTDGDLDPAHLDGLGERVDLPGRDVAEVPTGFQIYLPVFVAGSRAWAGPVVTLGIAQPVERVAVERVAAAVRVTWQWPPGLTLADVEWDGGWRRITLAEYGDRNGCAVPDVGAAREVRVVGITVTDDGELRATPVAAPVPPRRTKVRYEIRRGQLLRSASRVLRLTATADCEAVTVTVFAVPGSVMPLDPPAEAAVATVGPVRLVAGVPVTFPLSVPAAVHRSRPYWIVCRAAPGSDAELIDPPVEQMKVV